MHVPLGVPSPPPASGRGIYGAALSEMDALVGWIKRVADSHGKGNTLLWFAGTAGKPAAVGRGRCQRLHRHQPRVCMGGGGQDRCLSPALDAPGCSADGERSAAMAELPGAVTS